MHSFGLPQARGLAKAVEKTSDGGGIWTHVLVSKNPCSNHDITACLGTLSLQMAWLKFLTCSCIPRMEKPLKRINLIYLAGIVQIQDSFLSGFYLTRGHFIALPSKLWITFAMELLTCPFALLWVSKRTELQTSWEGGIGDGQGQWVELQGRGDTRAEEVGKPRFWWGKRNRVGYRCSI